MKKISIIDTSISDYNLGNQIIMDGVYKQLFSIFPKDFFFKLPYAEITPHTLSYINRSEFSIVGGANLLNGHLERYRDLDINLLKSFKLRNIILMGVGWWQYESNISLYSRFLLKQLLKNDFIHSVRDSYTQKKLESIGILNVINTGCPSIWNLNSDHCSGIPSGKTETVIFTITDYHFNHKKTQKIVDALSKNYENIFFWPQGEGDYELISPYLKEINVKMINPNLESYNQFLRQNDTDYVGTRLHAGIRALQHKKRTIIIGIDNRAIEMQTDFGLPVIPEKELDNLDDLIKSKWVVDIRLRLKEIDIWKKQFH